MGRGLFARAPLARRLALAFLGVLAWAPAASAHVAYVGTLDGNAVTPIDTATNLAGPPIEVPGGPTSIAITPDGKTAYVARATENEVIPIDLEAWTAGEPIVISAPMSIAITPDGETAYVADHGRGP